MLSAKKYLAGLGITLVLVMILFSVYSNSLSAQSVASEPDDILTRKKNEQPANLLDSFQERFESLMNKPFFQDPSLDNLRGFSHFDRNINEQFEQMFKSLNMFPGMPGFMAPFGNVPTQSEARTDIRESNDQLLVKIDLPGIDKNAIELKLKDNRLIITTERKETSTSKDDKGQVYRNEISYGSFSKVIELPRRVIENKIEAKYENGVLTVIAPIDTSNPQVEDGQKIKIN